MATQRNNSAKGAPAPATKGDGATRQMLQVVSKRDGFRRAGRAWSGTTTVALDELTQEQYEQLAAEPMLVTLLLETPADQVAELASADGVSAAATGN